VSPAAPADSVTASPAPGVPATETDVTPGEGVAPKPEAQPADGVAEDAPAPQPAEPAKPAPTAGAAAAAPDAEDDIGSLLVVVGASGAALLAAGAGALLWRRRRARRQAILESAASAPGVVEEAVDDAFAAAFDEPLGDGKETDQGSGAAPAGMIPAADPDVLSAGPERSATGVSAAAPDDLDALFSEEAIASAQAAIEAEVAGLEPDATKVEAAPQLAPAPAPAQPTAVDSGAGNVDEADDAADMEDVEVNLAKAYIDMGDPDGARAILEGMMADEGNPERAALAQRALRRFGLQSDPPPADA
jgi:FimV-like protein